MNKSVKINKYVIACGMALALVLNNGMMNVTYASSEPYYDSLKVFRNDLESTDSICGVIYLGEVDRNIDSLTDDRTYLEELLYSSLNAENYDFLWTIPNDLVIENDGGTELYCIVPADENASVAVNKYLMNEETYELELHDILYRSDYGDPFLVRCNTSELYRDTDVVIVDNTGEVFSWNPGLSAIDGKVEIPSEGPAIYDGTIYDDFAYNDALYEEDLYEDISYENNSYENEQEYADTIVETISLWEVVNCNEWVSLREEPDVNSARLAEVPLGTLVEDLGEYVNGFTYVDYAGMAGYIHDDYLLYYMGGDYADPCEGDIYYEEGLEPAATYPQLMTYEEIVSWGYEVLNFVNGKFTVYAAMDDEIEGEILKVGCFYDGKPVWGYVTECVYDTELQITDVFLAGWEQDPRVCIFNAEYGMTMIDLLSGDILWEISYEDLMAGGSLAYAVGDDGTIYCAGYYDYGPMAISADGEILWRNDPGNPDICWIHTIQIEDGNVVVDYVTGNEEGNDIVAFDMNTGDWVWTGIRSYY